MLKTLQQDHNRQISNIEFFYPLGQLRADPEKWHKDDKQAWGDGDPETSKLLKSPFNVPLIFLRDMDLLSGPKDSHQAPPWLLLSYTFLKRKYQSATSISQ